MKYNKLTKLGVSWRKYLKTSQNKGCGNIWRDKTKGECAATL